LRLDCPIIARDWSRWKVATFDAYMFSRDLRLTIGLPLAAGLSLNQFAGVLAHEFGHFAQTTGMGLTYVIQSINGWFARLVYEKDEFDAGLDNLIEETGGFIFIILSAGKGMIWLTRRILWALMHLGHFVSCFMLRQMEFDADRYEARLVGGDVFESTTREFRHLGLSAREANRDQGQFWNDGKLCNDMSKLTLFHRNKQNLELKKHVQNYIETTNTGWFDTHPCDRERIVSAHREHNQPAFAFDGSARILFRSFEKISQQLTRVHFQELVEISANTFRSFEELKQDEEKERGFLLARDRYFQLAVTPHYLPKLSLKRMTMPKSDDEIRQRLERVRNRMRDGLKSHEAAAQKYKKAHERYMQCLELKAMDDASLSINYSNEGLRVQDMAGVLGLKASAETAMSEALESYKQMDLYCSERLSLALSLVEQSSVKGAVDASLLNGFGACIKTHRLFHDLWEVLEDSQKCRALALRVVREARGSENDAIEEVFLRNCRKLMGAMNAFRDALKGKPYPLDHSDPDMNLRDYVLPSMLSMEDLGELFYHTGNAIVASQQLINRVHARLAAIGEAVEGVYHLEPLPAPDEALDLLLWSRKV